MRDPGYRDRISMMDKIYKAEAKKHPGVFYIPTWALFADAKGSYAEYLPDANGDPVLMRAPDGIHLTRAGGDRMAQAALDVIEKRLGHPAAAVRPPDGSVRRGAAQPELGEELHPEAIRAMPARVPAAPTIWCGAMRSRSRP